MPKQQARNEMELTKMLIGSGKWEHGAFRSSAPISYALNYVMIKISERYMELIEQKVYEAYDPSVYERSGQFRTAWNYLCEINGGNGQGEFKYDGSKLTYDPSKGQHGTPNVALGDYGTDDYYKEVADRWGDATEALAEIIFENRNGSLFPNTGWKRKRDAWTPLLKSVGSQRLKTWFKEGLSQTGVKFK